MGTPILVGFCTRKNPKDFLAWITTFRKSNPQTRVIVYCSPASRYVELEQFDVELVDCPDLWRNEADKHSIWKDRWDVMRREFQKLPDDSTVLVTDMGDVLFQRDPFAQIAPDGITVATEGSTHGDSVWGRSMYQHHYKDHPEILKHPIICAGVWAAPIEIARRFVVDAYETCRYRHSDVEQHSFNLTLQTKYADLVRAIPYKDAWTAHCSLMYRGRDNKGNPGERFEERPVLRDGKMVSEMSGKMFAIVHHVWLMLWPELWILGGGRTEW